MMPVKKTGFVQTQAQKPQARLRVLLRSGGRASHLRQLSRMTPAAVRIGWDVAVEDAPGIPAPQRRSLQSCSGAAAAASSLVGGGGGAGRARDVTLPPPFPPTPFSP